MPRFLGRQRKQQTERATEKTRRAWFRQVVSIFREAELDDTFWDELEELLILADVGAGPTMRLLDSLRERVRDGQTGDSDRALEMLKEEMVSVLSVDSTGWDREPTEPPLVVLMVGVNGSGKTTGIAKMASMYSGEGKQVLLGAADTFRAAAIEQLQAWGERLGVDVIAHRAGADPGAVAYDTLQAARSRKADVAIIDTAGRLHTKHNLMEEIKKVRRVLSRNRDGGGVRVLLTIDATTGQNGLFQARAFTEALSCDGVLLAKLDGTAKGGVAFSVSDELKLPVLYIGTGEQPEDIAAFDPEGFVRALFSGDGAE